LTRERGEWRLRCRVWTLAQISDLFPGSSCGWTCAFGFLVPVVLLLMFLNRPRRAVTRPRRTGRCAKCGYDLRATPDRCPECGTFAPADHPGYGWWDREGR
jgi:hypothetical protein